MHMLLSMMTPPRQDSFSDLRSPSALMEYEDASAIRQLDIVNPAFEYIPPELVDLLITNTGGHQPSYVYRLLDEYYNHEDYEVFGER
jgi:translation initiation factor eIF-2B subunit beta